MSQLKLNAIVAPAPPAVGKSVIYLDVADGIIKAKDSAGVVTAFGTSSAGPFPESAITGLVADLALKAPLASPALTGTPSAPTAAALTNTTQLATTAFVVAAVAALVASSPATLDTLNELALALGSDPNFATTIATALGLKAPLASPALTGTPTAPTAGAGTNTTQIATTAFALAQDVLEVTARDAAIAAAVAAVTYLPPRVAATTSSATPTPNANTTDVYILTAQAAAAFFTNPTGSPVQGQTLTIRIKDNGTARALTYDTQYRPVGVALPTTTVISKTMYQGYRYNATDTKWDLVAVSLEA
jgi:hypothetical protein